jgi:hypothetical protein
MLWPSKWNYPHQNHYVPRHITSGPARLPVQVSGWWGHINWKTFCTGLTRAANAGQKSHVLAWRAQQTNEGRTPFICTLLAPFTSVSTATPLWFLWSCSSFAQLAEKCRPDIWNSTWWGHVHVIVQYIINVREKVPTWSDQARLSRVGTASVSILPPLEQDYTVLYTCWSYSYIVYVAEGKKI